MVRDLLVLTKQILERPEHWTPNFWSQDRVGSSCPALDERAHSFTLLGALEKANFLQSGQHERPFVDKESIYYPLALANGRLTHSQILAALDRAIQLATH